MGKMFNPTTVTIDSTPIQDSGNAVSSGGVYDELEKVSDVTIAQLISSFGSYQHYNQALTKEYVDSVVAAVVYNQRPRSVRLLIPEDYGKDAYGNFFVDYSISGVIADEMAQRITLLNPDLNRRDEFDNCGFYVYGRSANKLEIGMKNPTESGAELYIIAVIEDMRPTDQNGTDI